MINSLRRVFLQANRSSRLARCFSGTHSSGSHGSAGTQGLGVSPGSVVSPGTTVFDRSKLSSLKRGEEREATNLNVGDCHHNFELVSKDYFPDFDFTVYKFEHRKLGTVHFHFDTNDTNNCFAFNFTTLPDDSSGKMHVLEHLALCGSNKYPVRDPFMNMIRRSLNTYMNAWTGPDFTSYPYSTVNAADFYNLMSVYAESVFKPLLRKTDFLQEGWRLEFADPKDPKSELQIKGVVYNEMKGYYENADLLFMEGMQNHLFKGTPYVHDAGGRPSHIPSLTHEALREFHARNYHPSNATVFTYGDLNVLEHQNFLENNFLKDFEKLRFAKPILKSSLREEERVTLKLPPPAVSIKDGWDSMFGVGFLCNDIGEDIQDTVGLHLLSYLLFDTPKSPFYVDFLEAGLADAFTQGHGHESSLYSSFFTVGFKNIKRGSEKEIEAKIFETLNRVAKEGFDKGTIESALHQLEVNSKIAKPNFGLQLFQTHLGALNHRSDALLKQGLNVKEAVEFIREHAPNRYFEKLIEKYFLQNKRRLYLTMEVDADYNKRLEQKEEELIKKFETSLTDADRHRIVEEAAKLKTEQEAEQHVDVLPTLLVSDIPLRNETTSLRKETVAGIETYFCEKPTNGVTHFRIKANLKGLDHSQVFNLHLLSLMLDKIGTQEHKHEEFNELLSLHTTGIHVNLHYDGSPANHDEINSFAVISVSCLDRNLETMFRLLGELLTTPDFKDFEHISKLIRLDSTAAANDVVQRPLDFGIDYGISSRRPAKQFFNKLANNRFLCNYGSHMQQTPAVTRIFLEELELNMNYIFHKLLKKDALSFSVHSSNLAPSHQQLVRDQITGLVLRLKFGYKRFDNTDLFNASFDFRPEYFKDYFAIPSQTNYVTETVFTPGYLHDDSPKLDVLSELLARGQLHKLIREKGGAYGSGAKFNALTGSMSLFSYRDPQFLTTLDNFRSAVRSVADGHFSKEDVDSAKLSLFSKVDMPVPNQSHGMRLFLHGLTDEQVQERRGKLLEVTKSDLEDVARKYLKGPLDANHSSKVVFGPETADLKVLEKEGWKIEKFSEGLKLREKLFDGAGEDEEHQTM